MSLFLFQPATHCCKCSSLLSTKEGPPYQLGAFDESRYTLCRDCWDMIRPLFEKKVREFRKKIINTFNLKEDSENR